MEALEALQDPVEFNADSKAIQILGDEIVRPSRFQFRRLDLSGFAAMGC